MKQKTMTDAPVNFAESPSSHADSSSLPDALSDVLEAIHLRGGVVSRSVATGQRSQQHPRGIRLLHIVERGSVDVHLDGTNATIHLEAGELALLARGEPHTLDGDDEASWVTGIFLVEDAIADPLLAVLPSSLVIPSTGAEHGWLSLSLALLVDEVAQPRPGSQVMVSRILDLLFIHALRVWATSGDTAPGWLSAAMDDALAPALTAIHRHPGREWSVNELARQANMSRSAFAARFRRLLGQAPLAYVTDLRLDQAARLLSSTADPVHKIACEVGYTSDAAFSRAFHRRFGSPPGRWRRHDTSTSGTAGGSERDRPGRSGQGVPRPG